MHKVFLGQDSFRFKVQIYELCLAACVAFGTYLTFVSDSREQACIKEI